MATLRIGILASHEGSIAQSVIDACKSKKLDAEVGLIISNNSDSTVLKRARNENVPWRHLSNKTHPDPRALDKAMLDAFIGHGVNLVLLLGYLRRLGPKVISHYRGRILNIHPALLPKHGGQGMFGMHVHQAVLSAKEKETGVTIHIVDEEYDQGQIVARCKVPVLEGDSPETLAEHVRAREREFLIETLKRIVAGELSLGDVPEGP